MFRGGKMSEMYQKKVKPYIRHIGTLAMYGAREEEIAAMLGISQRTLRRYKSAHTELKEALEKKKNADTQVLEAFFKRACGYTAREETTECKGKKNEDGLVVDEQVVKKTVKKEVPPDLSAIKWWLENSGQPVEEEMDVEEARELLLERRRLQGEED